MRVISLLSVLSVSNLLGISNAFAAAAQTPRENFLSILPIIAVFVVFMYFLIIRPQSKKAKEHQQLITSLKVGDEVITTGGLLGKITKIVDSFMIIVVAKDVEIVVQKGSIATSVPKGTIKSI